ncbi:hypothetical protein [Actinomadura rubrisoli]|uniref:Uncharacterized protein n=1 Tax=Actinomadura rubrisoli TaxID=2530368 RepID=A0A4R5B8Z6_9ACTN|nr:hypothetical protein [Actinomadura rubrisoli]TDD81110.1 hypothetical protein E1298_24615 [Actinomadura rubrisoli]
MRKLVPLSVAAAVGIGSLAAVPFATSSSHGSAAAPVKAASPYCEPVNKAKVTSKSTTKKISERDVIYNRTRDVITRQVHFEKTESTTWKVSGGVEATFKALIFSEIKAHVNAGVDKTYTVRKGYADTVKVRKGYKMTATRGWRLQQASGYVYHVYSNCKTQTKGGFNFKAPYTEYVEYKAAKL